MKLLELEIEHFGVFSGVQLQFSPGFQVVYGENEAGKSTLLQLIRELFFGFPHQSRYAFESHQGEMAATGRVEMADGALAHFRRRKGSKNKVAGKFDISGETIDEHRLARMLSHASAELYQHVFGFSLSELAAGEKSLAQANLAEALFGGGLGGLAAMQQAQAALREEREQLFVPRAKNRVINELLQQVKRYDEQLRRSMFKPRDFQELSKTYEQCEAEVDRLGQSLEQLRRRDAHCRRLSEALPHWLQRKVAQKELDTLEVPADFPPDAPDEYRRNRERLEEVDHELAAIGQELESVAESLSHVVLSPELVERETEIKHLQQQIGKIQGFRGDLPPRRQDAATIRNAVLARLGQLNPSWNLEHLELFRSSLAQRERFQSMRDQWDQLQRQKSELEAQRPALLTDISTAEKRLAELDATDTVPLLEDAIQRQPQYEADQQAVLAAEKQLQIVNAELQTLRTKLDAPLKQGPSHLEKLPVPMEPTVDEFRHRFAEIHKAIDRHEQTVEGIRSELTNKQLSLEELEAEQQIPSREELLAQRAHRDEGWQLIRQKYIRGKVDAQTISRWLGGSEQLLADAYEREVTRADQLADRLQVDAETVARREQLVAEIERVQQRLDAAERQHNACLQQLQELTHDWHNLWAPCGFQPLSPEAMRDWLRLHSELLDKLEEKATIEVQRRDLEARVGDFEDELRDALPEPPQSPQRQLAAARKLVEQAHHVAAERKTYQTQLPQKTDQLQRLDHELAETAQRIEAWNQQWQPLLADAGFPAEWDIHVAIKILSGLEEARQEYSQALAQEQAAADMEKELAEFEAQVAALCQTIAPDVDQLPAEEKVAQLAHRLDAAQHSQRDQARLLEEQAKLQQRQQAKAAQRENLQGRIDQLWQAAHAESEAQFHAVAAAAARRCQLQATIDSATQQINTIRGTEEQRPFENELAEVDADSVAAQLRKLEEELSAREVEYRAAAESLGIHRDRLQKLDQESDSLTLQMQLESTRSELASAVDRWAPLVLAETMMKQAIARFEQEHQPKMLQEVTRLLARMTRDRYTGVRRRLDGTLLVEQEDGSVKQPDQLSRGTREQLYLAIRLAYVQHYSQNAEPLPLVVDDVLVNFDDDRALGALEVFWEVAENLQIIFLTCHQSMVDLVKSARPGEEPIQLQTKAVTSSP
jgi:uncharacterized protein YhaN